MAFTQIDISGFSRPAETPWNSEVSGVTRVTKKKAISGSWDFTSK